MTRKLTREQAEDTIEGLEGMISRGVQSVYLDMAIAGMRQLIATLDSEPVAVVELSDYVTAAQLVGEGPARKAVHELYEGALRIGDKLYRHAQPAPVVQDERAAFNAWNNEDNLPIAGVGAKNAAWLAWQARAGLGGLLAPVVSEEVLADLEYEANHITAWYHMDEHSCKVNRRHLLTLVNACRAAMLAAVPPAPKQENV